MREGWQGERINRRRHLGLREKKNEEKEREMSWASQEAASQQTREAAKVIYIYI